MFEIHDWSCCPQSVRNGLTGFLQTFITRQNIYRPIRGLLLEAIEHSGTANVVDLCSGAGGPWVAWAKRGHVEHLSVTLTDKFPNSAVVRSTAERRISQLRYCAQPVDATAVPADLQGFRTMFTAFHHFTPEQGKAMIDDAVRNGQGIGIFEFTSRTFAKTLGMLLTPIGVLLLVPRLKRVGWKVLALTYLLPLIPLVACIDGVLSCLRSYSAADLRQLAQSDDYEWSSGEENGITYLIGIPLACSAPLSARTSTSAQTASV